MDNRAAGIGYVGDIAVALLWRRADQRMSRARQQSGWVIAVEQAGADAIVAHRSHAVGQHQPAFINFDGRATIADLDELPRPARRNDFGATLPVI